MKLFEMLLTGVGNIVMYVVVYLLADLCWIGAEYLFEGAVHSSKVDGYVLALLTCYIVKDLKRLEKELVEGRKDHATD